MTAPPSSTTSPCTQSRKSSTTSTSTAGGTTLVKWVGWPLEAATWEPYANIKHLDFYLKDFKDPRKLKDKRAKQEDKLHESNPN